MKILTVIAGATSSGKTALSIKLARHYQSEIISADSRQFYRGMDIGTAKPSPEELDAIPHHLINSLNVTEAYNIGRFETEALALANALFQIHDVIFLVGGSGLYIDAMCDGIDDLPESVPAIRNELYSLIKTSGIEALQEKLRSVDPEYYSEVDLNNPQRLMRALEVYLVSGKKYSALRLKNKKSRDFMVKKIGLLVDRDELYERINNRVDSMISNGLVEEVKSLLAFRYENALQTVGYKEIFDYFDSQCTLPEAINRIKQNTRNYAKRQMTWFRRDPEIKWFEADEMDKMIRYIDGK